MLNIAIDVQHQNSQFTSFIKKKNVTFIQRTPPAPPSPTANPASVQAMLPAGACVNSLYSQAATAPSGVTHSSGHSFQSFLANISAQQHQHQQQQLRIPQPPPPPSLVCQMSPPLESAIPPQSQAPPPPQSTGDMLTISTSNAQTHDGAVISPPLIPNPASSPESALIVVDDNVMGSNNNNCSDLDHRRRSSSIAALRLKAREHELRLEMMRQLSKASPDIVS